MHFVLILCAFCTDSGLSRHRVVEINHRTVVNKDTILLDFQSKREYDVNKSNGISKRVIVLGCLQGFLK